jgi:hypothetical protein
MTIQDELEAHIKKSIAWDSMKSWLESNIKYLSKIKNIKSHDEYIRVDGELQSMEMALNQMNKLESEIGDKWDA